MTHEEAVELLLRDIEDLCYADNIHDDARREEAISRLAKAHQRIMREAMTKIKISDTDDRFRWFQCSIGIHWCSEWSNPDDDEERRYQTQRCLRCNKVWERRIPVR